MCRRACNGQEAALFVVDDLERVSDTEQGAALRGFARGCHAVIFSTDLLGEVAAWHEIMKT
ncbi:hypothetical protein FM21_25580 [Streptomyces mutabilis]|uniref:Uncharacterized protein n=1 Tax=Streptomyces mutabilis TaxID=67332 RepID=A0A086MZ30_9ACTN|nr:hypothetical protein FM21_25580 [Streptomyces mutabilis]